MPEKFRNKPELESEIEMLKIKVSLVKSNVDDLNEEVCQNVMLKNYILPQKLATSQIKPKKVFLEGSKIQILNVFL